MWVTLQAARAILRRNYRTPASVGTWRGNFAPQERSQTKPESTDASGRWPPSRTSISCTANANFDVQTPAGYGSVQEVL